MRNLSRLISIVFLITAVILSASVVSASDVQTAFDDFCSNLFIEVVGDDPERISVLGNLESFGIKSRNSELSDVSVAASKQRYDMYRKNLAALLAFDISGLSPVQQASAATLRWYLEDKLQSEEFDNHWYLADPLYGIHIDYTQFMTYYHPVTDRISAENYIARLKLCGKRFDQVIELMKIQEEQGILMPQFAVTKSIDQITSFLNQGTTSNDLYKNLSKRLDEVPGISGKEKRELLSAAKDAISDVVQPAYKRLRAYLTDLKKRARKTDGVWDLPNGDAYYQCLLNHYTSTDLAPIEIHQIGLAEVARIQAEMMPVFRELGFTASTVGENYVLLRKNGIKDKVYWTPKEILDGYRALVQEIEGWLPQLFSVLPKAPVDIVAQPAYSSGPNLYSSGSLDGTRPAFFGVNVTNGQYLGSMRLLACHETLPGHHLQQALQKEQTGLPTIQRSYLIGCTAFTEGWALYAERLANEYGYFKTPQDKFFYLESEYYRAMRLVLDTGIHALKWTRSEAMAYAQKNYGTSWSGEIDRYIVMPGQACAYKIGQLKILELRERARQALGDRFDIKEFHWVVLRNGSIPLSVLEDEVQRYIDSKQS